MENFRFFGAPHVAMITTDQALGVYGAVDCGAYVANFLLAAASLGVATIPQAALAVRPQRVRDYFGLSSDRLVVCGISLGYAEPSHPANSFRTTRADIATAVQWKGMI
ncbi:nitroreductase [Pseudomonas sp. ATCC 13867]|nr:nitroreductase [Pseudomonas sp. ATCC 13867]